MAKEKITFYKRWRDTTIDLPDESRLEVYDAIVQYAFDGKTRRFVTALAKVAFGFIKLDIDKDCKRQAEISAKRRNAGKQGGAPKNNRNAVRNKEQEQPKEPISAPTQQENLFGDVELVAKKRKPQKPIKHKYAECVRMTEAEYQKLIDAYGYDGVQWMITKLDNYKAARGMTYKSDYRAILNWVTKEYEKEKSNERNTEVRRDNKSQYNPTTAKQQRDAEFAEHINKKLSSG